MLSVFMTITFNVKCGKSSLTDRMCELAVPPAPHTVQPYTVSVQSSLHDTVKSTTANSFMSRSKLFRTRCSRKVNFLSRLADYRSNSDIGEEHCGVHKTNKADRITCAKIGWKVWYVTGGAENKRGVRAETSSVN
ncbi:hypothetical protein ACTXT7_016283 [Hymenolepis weldensis]